MRHTVMSSLRPVPGSYRFTKVRYAGRFQRVRNCPADETTV